MPPIVYRTLQILSRRKKDKKQVINTMFDRHAKQLLLRSVKKAVPPVKCSVTRYHQGLPSVKLLWSLFFLFHSIKLVILHFILAIHDT